MPLNSRKLYSTEYYRLKFRFLGEENFARMEVANHSVLYREVLQLYTHL